MRTLHQRLCSRCRCQYTLKLCIRYRVQDGIEAAPHPAHQGHTSLVNGRVKAVDPCFCEQPSRATQARQPRQHPERIIILNPEDPVGPLRIIPPQTARVPGSTICSEQCNFNFPSTTIN